MRVRTETLTKLDPRPELGTADRPLDRAVLGPDHGTGFRREVGKADRGGCQGRVERLCEGTHGCERRLLHVALRLEQGLWHEQLGSEPIRLLFRITRARVVPQEVAIRA